MIYKITIKSLFPLNNGLAAYKLTLDLIAYAMILSKRPKSFVTMTRFGK